MTYKEFTVIADFSHCCIVGPQIIGGNCMKSTLLAIAASACSFGAIASTQSSQSMDQFCSDRASIKSVKELTESSYNLMGFANGGGIGNGGVCWWHSRMQRNALYLTIYKPGERKPSKAQAKIIVEKIREGEDVVVIPGFDNFQEFSVEYREIIQRELDKWQKGDGVLRFNWVIGLKGKSEVSADKMKEMMDELYDYVEVKGNIAYEKLQIKGIVAHAWLVVNMKKVEKGYDLEVLDSNYPIATLFYSYRPGMTSFNHYAYGNFVPYLERTEEMNKLKNVVLKKCNPEEYNDRKGDEKDNENLVENRLSKN
jgi:hypothetical protein